MPVPDFLGKNVQEADAVINRALADVVGCEEASVTRACPESFEFGAILEV
jgi:hypothetical protein